MNKNDTLHGGRDVQVKVYGGVPGQVLEESWTVRQFKVREYRDLFPISDDELKLCARATGKTEAQIGELVPESYERIHAAMREVNEGGFFIYRGRQLEKGNDALRDLPPELVDKLVKLNLPVAAPPASSQMRSPTGPLR